jgi:ArsR family transcriptional regulator
MIYELPPLAVRSPELAANLACLQDCTAGRAVFRRDLARLAKVDLNCGPVSVGKAVGVCGCAPREAVSKK